MYKLEYKKLKKGNRIKIEGELSIYSVKSIYEEIKISLSYKNKLLLDLYHITEMDSAGLQLILLIQREFKKYNMPIEIEKQSSAVSDLFKLFNIKLFKENF